MTRVLVPLADGVEEMEAVIIIDMLRRAKWEVVSASIGTSAIGAEGGSAESSTTSGADKTVTKTVRGSRGVRLLPDSEWRNVDAGSFDVLVLPGGSVGTKALSSNRSILETIRNFVCKEKTVAAICAAPLVLQSAGVLDGRRATCHPAVRDKLTSARVQNDRVVIDRRIVTSQGAGTAFEFSLAIIRLVDGKDAADVVAEEL